MIEAKHLTKRYGKTVAVDEVSFTVRPGQVTGFLGPNGAGKSTTMRMILGLELRPPGEVSCGRQALPPADDPLRSVGRSSTPGHRRRPECRQPPRRGSPTATASPVVG